MFKPHYGRKWRGFPWSHWNMLVNQPTMANLRVLIETHNQKSVLAFPRLLIKRNMVEMAMAALDEHVPRLNNKQVEEAFRSAELSQQNPHFGKNPQGYTFVVDNLITSDQIQLTYIDEVETAIWRFLQAVHRQDCQLAESCLPYLPALPFSGGPVINSKAFLRSLLGAPNPGISSLVVRTRVGRDDYVLSRTGQVLPYRGRGPVWNNNSCALDCVIVAARLLNLGRTVADIGDEPLLDWQKALPYLVGHFIRLAAQPWEVLDNQTSYDLRRAFLTRFLRIYNNPNNPTPTKIGDFLPVTAVWSLSTCGMMQMNFFTRTYSKCSKCPGKIRDAVTPITKQAIYLPQLSNKAKDLVGATPTMEKLLNFYFSIQRGNCVRCNSPAVNKSRNAVYGSLPPRLVVFPNGDYRDVVEATDETIRIRYMNTVGAITVATYRWLGGIYQTGNHYRLYWNDREPNLNDQGPLMVYDGLNLEGSILGGVIPNDNSAKVPPEWSKGADILFYERLDYSVTLLHDAARAVKKAVDDNLKERLEVQQKAQRNESEVDELEGIMSTEMT